MTAPSASPQLLQPEAARALIHRLGAASAAASRTLASATTEQKNSALGHVADLLRASADDLLVANAEDVAAARLAERDTAFVDRLMLNKERVEAMAAAIEAIARLPDPVGRVLMTQERPNGLLIERVSTPLGVIGMIYESRPNVGADAGALCIKAGNAVILRGGSDSRHSTRIIVDAMRRGLCMAELPRDCVQFIDTDDRDAVTELLKCTEFVDLVIPRGGRGLVSLVQEQARVPTLLHLDGNCHSYVHKAADVDKAVSIIRNAKLRRTGVCGATESLVIDSAIATRFLPKLLDAMPDCEFRGDASAQGIDNRVVPAAESDWGEEYLSATLSVRVAESEDDAFEFVRRHSSGHTDAILTEDAAVAQRFLKEIDSAVVMHNASTQFSDGGEFGMGAEIGIATGKLHARGPVGLEQLNTFKYLVHGSGQTRP